MHTPHTHRKKDFRKWHDKKAMVHAKTHRVFFHEREIWFCHLGENVGFEQDGRGEEFLRPIVILKKFNNEVLWGIPLTKNERKENHPYYFVFVFRPGAPSAAILSQIRLIDAKRLKYKIGEIPESNFSALKAKIRQLLA